MQVSCSKCGESLDIIDSESYSLGIMVKPCDCRLNEAKENIQDAIKELLKTCAIQGRSGS